MAGGRGCSEIDILVVEAMFSHKNRNLTAEVWPIDFYCKNFCIETFRRIAGRME